MCLCSDKRHIHTKDRHLAYVSVFCVDDARFNCFALCSFCTFYDAKKGVLPSNVKVQFIFALH